APELHQKIAAWIDRWNDDDFAVREDASSQLAQIGMPAVAQLSAAMESDSAEIRIRARRTRTAVWSPKAQAHLGGHAAGASSVTFSPDEKWIASGDNAGVVRLWDAKSRMEIAKLILEEKRP